MVNNITIKRILEKFKSYYKWCVVIICMTLLSVFIVINFLEKPNYYSSSQILLSTKKLDNESSENEVLKINMQLLNTVSPIISSERTMEQVRKNLNIDTSSKKLKADLELISGENSLVFTIKVKNSNPVLARKITDEIAQVVYKDIPELFDFTKIIILEKADKATKQSRNYRYILAIIISVFSSFSLILLLTIFDTTIRSKKQIESLGLVFLGEVPISEILRGDNISETRKQQQNRI